MKKRIIAIIMVLVLLLLATACGKGIENNAISTTTEHYVNQTSENIIKTRADSNTLVTEPDKITEDSGGGYITSSKYRQRYYTIPHAFAKLVNKEEYLVWREETYQAINNETNVMTMILFIQHFNISKEIFERANLEMAKDFVEMGEKPTMKPQDYENQQMYEIYNADIVYTFDNDLINEYYLTPDYPYCADFEYEAAVKRGEYTSQTEEWIDVEQMEAEINAKYGAPEVTETATAIPEETEVTE